MSQSSKTYQPTPEQLARWKEIDELESGAIALKGDASRIAGLLPPEEEQARIVKEFLETDYIDSQLEKVRAHKEKLLKKLKSALRIRTVITRRKAEAKLMYP